MKSRDPDTVIRNPTLRKFQPDDIGILYLTRVHESLPPYKDLFFIAHPSGFQNERSDVYPLRHPSIYFPPTPNPIERGTTIKAHSLRREDKVVRIPGGVSKCFNSRFELFVELPF